MYEFFEHTADLGLRVRAATREELLVDAARALFAAIVENPESIQPLEPIHVAFPLEEDALLLFDWLNALLFHFDVEHRVLGRFEVRLSEAGLEGIAWGESLDPARHVLGHEVKAITYHALRLDRDGEHWIAEVIVDI